MPAYGYELKIRKIVKNELKRQHEFLMKHGEELYNNAFLRYFTRYKTLDGIEKGFNRLEDFREQMGIYEMVDKIFEDVKKVVQVGYKSNYRLHKQEMSNFGISFDLNNPAVNQYMRDFETLQLSDYKGSISFTTKNNVIAELRKGVDENLSYTQVAQNIQALDQTLFSFNRAKLIAVRETGLAYEYGNYVPMREVAAQGAQVEKKRLTVHDDRVTAQCRANENEGRIPLAQVRSSGDDLPPRDANPRCRCTAQRQVR